MPKAYKTCEQCFRKQSSINYYRAGNNKRGYFPICKSCVLLLTSNNNTTEAAKILRRMDRPFIKDFWDEMYYKYGDKAIGYYFAKISALTKYKDLTYEHSVFESEQKIDEGQLFYNMEWQGSFSMQDLNCLNDYYDKLHRDYKITTQNHKDYARKVAKTSLAMDKAYSRMVNDKDPNAHREYKELKSIFDDLCKSARFSESTRSANDVGLGSFGVIFNKVEQKKWIPEFKPLKKDTYDILLDQFANIEKSL